MQRLDEVPQIPSGYWKKKPYKNMYPDGKVYDVFIQAKKDIDSYINMKISKYAHRYARKLTLHNLHLNY